MISFIQISERLKDTKQKNENANEEFDYEILFKYSVPPFNILPCYTKKGGKAQWEKKLSKILAFVKGLQYIKDDCVVMPISSTNSRNLAIWGSSATVCTARKDMTAIGILSLVSEDPRYGRADTRSCHTYKYYRDNAIKFIRFCEDNHIEPFVFENYKLPSVTELPGINKTKVLFKSNLRLKKPDGVSVGKVEKYLLNCLHENYPHLEVYQKLADNINRRYYKDYQELHILFTPKFRWSKSGGYITKIGIRATCSLNNTKKEKRASILEDYEFDKRKDIASSVPRLTLSLHKGRWVSEEEEVDLYKEIYKNCGYDDEFSEDMREAIKKLFMRAYFDSTEKNMVNHTWRDMNQKGILRQEVDAQMHKLREAIEKTCGKSFRSYIFFVESCVYLRVFQRLLELGRSNGWLLYDAFYCRGLEGEDNEQFKGIVEQYLKESFAEYLKLYNNQSKKTKKIRY